tara:strand:+ start:3535 stop:4404 length:870 start_codon:yes stop_codon:yes gene_type:complete
MANGIQSLNPDKQKRKKQKRPDPFVGMYLNEMLGRGSLPDTLPTDQFQELLGDVQAQGWARDWDQAQAIPADKLLPTLDSLTALVSGNYRDAPMVRLQDEQELLDTHRGLTPEDWGRDLAPMTVMGMYFSGQREPTMWLNQPELYGLIGEEEDDASTKTLKHEVMHHLQQVAGRDPELREIFYDKVPLQAHGPEAFTANTLTAAWDALASLSDDGKASKEDVIDYMVENYGRYDERPNETDEPRVLPRDQADKTATWLATQNPFKTELYERTMLEKLRRGLASLLKKGG